MEVDTGRETRLLEHRAQDVLRRAGIGRRLEYDDGAGAQLRGDGATGAKNGTEVGTVGGVERSGHADDDDVGLGDDRRVGGRHEAAGDHLGDVGVGQVVDVGTTAGELGDDQLRHVETDDPVT